MARSASLQKTFSAISEMAREVWAHEPTPKELMRHTVHRRAVEAAIWGMPLVSFEAMRRAYFEDAEAGYNDIVYLSKPADWKFQLTTPNASSLYVYFNYNLKDGPVVIELPAAEGAGLFGSLEDAWQTPIVDIGPEGEDKGAGGKYLLLPPGYKEEIPAGYIRALSRTYNGYGAFRAIPVTQTKEDVDKALALVKQLRVYPLAQPDSPPEQRYINIAGKLFDGIAHFDDRFYDALARMVNEEPIQPRDMVMMAQLRSLGIRKGKEFKPDADTRKVLKEAITEAHTGFKADAADTTPYWPATHWGMNISAGPKTAFSFETEDHLEIDERGQVFFLACAAPKKLGAASFYLSAFRDIKGEALHGERSYRLRVPADVPARQFWAVTVYDLESAAFIREAKHVEINSYHEDMEKNPDGSVDVNFGAEAPDGEESNWIATVPGKKWFAFFRFYGPEQAVRDKTWQLPDIEQII